LLLPLCRSLIDHLAIPQRNGKGSEIGHLQEKGSVPVSLDATHAMLDLLMLLQPGACARIGLRMHAAAAPYSMTESHLCYLPLSAAQLGWLHMLRGRLQSLMLLLLQLLHFRDAVLLPSASQTCKRSK
jgi:hypothetical protein